MYIDLVPRYKIHVCRRDSRIYTGKILQGQGCICKPQLVLVAAMGMTTLDSRLLHPFGLDMPPSEIILQNSNEALFRIIEPFGAG